MPVFAIVQTFIINMLLAFYIINSLVISNSNLFIITQYLKQKELKEAEKQEMYLKKENATSSKK